MPDFSTMPEAFVSSSELGDGRFTRG